VKEKSGSPFIAASYDPSLPLLENIPEPKLSPMKWLSVTLVLMVVPACQIHDPATAPPGMPLDREHTDTVSGKILTHTTPRAGSSAVAQ